MNFMFHTMLDAADVSFSQVSVSTIFRWGGDFFIHV